MKDNARSQEEFSHQSTNEALSHSSRTRDTGKMTVSILNTGPHVWTWHQAQGGSHHPIQESRLFSIARDKFFSTQDLTCNSSLVTAGHISCLPQQQFPSPFFMSAEPPCLPWQMLKIGAIHFPGSLAAKVIMWPCSDQGDRRCLPGNVFFFTWEEKNHYFSPLLSSCLCKQLICKAESNLPRMLSRRKRRKRGWAANQPWVPLPVSVPWVLC